MKLSSQQKLIATALGIAVIVVLGVFLLVLPQATKLGDLDKQIRQAEQDVESARALLEQRQDIKAHSAETEARLLKLANEIPESPELPSFIIELQDVVNESGLEFAELTPNTPVSDPAGFEAGSMELVVQGRWPDTVDLLQRLRRLTRQIRILGFKTEPYVEEGAATQSVALPVDLETYVRTTLTLQIYTMPATESTVTVPAAPAQ